MIRPLPTDEIVRPLAAILVLKPLAVPVLKPTAIPVAKLDVSIEALEGAQRYAGVTHPTGDHP